MSQVPLSSIISVSISRDTQGITQAGFGTPIIVTNETPLVSWGSEKVREYSSTDEVLEDWTSSDDVYLAAVAVFAQTPKVATIKVGLETTRVAQVITLVFSADLVALNVVGAFNVTSGGKSETVTATTFAVSNANTLGLITAKLQALAGVNAVDDGSHTITITAANVGAAITVGTPVVTLGASQATATVTTTVANVGPAESMAAISEEDDDWYGVVWVERNEDLVYNMIAYIETKRRLFGTTTSDVDVYSDSDTDDIAYIASAANFERTFVCWNGDPTDYMEAAWMGKIFPYDPGSATWKFKTLTGITVDVLTTARRTAIQNKNCNMYVEIAGTSMTQEGVVASGEYIDIIHGVDWLEARLQERIFSRLIGVPKVPFTDAGIAIVENEIRAVLENAIRVGLLSPDPLDPTSDDRRRKTQPYIINTPRASEVPVNDRAERHLTGITFEAHVAGAVHKVTIMGNVTV